MANNVTETTPLLEDVRRDDFNTEFESQKDVQKTPFPWKSASAIFCLCAMQPLVFELIFPFINQMLLEIGVVDDPERVGFYSGFIESLFACMNFICIIPSSYLSNRFGRKPVLLFSISGMAISVALFGMSKSYGAMILTRIIGGAGGGSWATMKVMVAELTAKSNQATAFTGLSVSYRIGQSVGQPLGGLLAHPERRSEYFNTPFWREYPFSLPCFVAAGTAGIFIIMGYFNLKETLTRKGSSDQSTKTSWSSVLDHRTISVLTSIAVMFFTVEITFALYPLFAFTPIASGGLGLSEAEIGAHTAIRAATGILTMFLFSPLHRRFGTVRTYQLALCIWPFVVAFLPALNMLARLGQIGSVLFNSLLTLFFFVWAFASISFPCQALMITNCARTSESLSTLMSISQMSISLVQAIAPAFITSLFAFSLKTDFFGAHLTWIAMLIMTCGSAIHGWRLQESDRD